MSIKHLITLGLSLPSSGGGGGQSGDCVHYRCLTTVQTRIQAIGLDSLSNSNVVVTWLPRWWESADTTPRLCIVPLGKEGQPGILTGRDDIEYPVVVAILAKQNQDFTLGLQQRLKWRQSIFRTFRNQRLPGVPEIITTHVDPDYVVNPELFHKGIFCSSILFKFKSREVRGLGA